MENLKEIIEEECKKHIKDVRSQIRELLKKATLSLMGLEDRGRHVEVDHCNGRNSVLIDAFRQCAIDEAKKIATNYKPSSESIVHYAATFQGEFDRHFRSEVSKMAREKAKTEAQNIVSAIDVDIKKIVEEL